MAPIIQIPNKAHPKEGAITDFFESKDMPTNNNSRAGMAVTKNVPIIPKVGISH
jgi:hypothetical protein